MPVLLRIRAIKFYIYSLEEDRPHVHVKVQSFIFKIWLDNVTLEKSNAPSFLENKVLKLVKLHKNELLESWHGYFGNKK